MNNVTELKPYMESMSKFRDIQRARVLTEITGTLRKLADDIDAGAPDHSIIQGLLKLPVECCKLIHESQQRLLLQGQQQVLKHIDDSTMGSN
jgi:hypothetical protein